MKVTFCLTGTLSGTEVEQTSKPPSVRGKSHISISWWWWEKQWSTDGYSHFSCVSVQRLRPSEDAVDPTHEGGVLVGRDQKWDVLVYKGFPCSCLPLLLLPSNRTELRQDEKEFMPLVYFNICPIRCSVKLKRDNEKRQTSQRQPAPSTFWKRVCHLSAMHSGIGWDRKDPPIGAFVSLG